MRTAPLLAAALAFALVAGVRAGQEPSAPLALLAVEPREVSAGGDTLVTVKGHGLARSTHVRIGDRPLRHARLGADGAITGYVPALRDGEPLGPRDVVAHDGRERVLLPGGVIYVRAAAVDEQLAALARLRRESLVPVTVRFRNGIPRALSLRVKADGATSLERARAFLAAYRDLFAQDNPHLALGVHRADHDEGEDVLFFQTFRGVPVHHGGALVRLRDGFVVTVLASLLDERATPDFEQVLTARQAEDRLRDFLRLRVAPLTGDSALVIYDPALTRGGPSAPQLAWRVALGGSEPLVGLVDAARGEILELLTREETSGGPLHDLDYYLADAENDANASDDYCFEWSDDVGIADEDDFDPDYLDVPSAVKADEFAKRVYGFYHETFNRHSFDADSTQFEVFINANFDPSKLAGWSPDCDLIQFAPHGVADDVMTHEFTHGVIGSSSALVYSFQSGALNESFADVMAEIEDQQNSEAKGLSTDWLHGEDVGKLVLNPFSTGPNRDLEDPAKNGSSPCFACATQPDHIDNYDPRCDAVIGGKTFCWDNGGVHRNSGIFNKARVLMSDGGTHAISGVTVDGMGRNKMRALAYWSLRHLPFFADFEMAVLIEKDEALDWVGSGAHGFTYADYCTVHNAYAAVGLEVPDADCDGSSDALEDIDGDGVQNPQDNCMTVPNANQKNLDNDPYGDACDDDDDNDGHLDFEDQCPGYKDPTGDNGPCDDFDVDGWPNDVDSCPFDYNKWQTDANGDGIGDACAVDPDADGVDAQFDNCPLTPNPEQVNSDGDIYGDACDRCPLTTDPKPYKYAFNGLPFQPDTDDDGTPDACDLGTLIEQSPAIAGLLVPDGRTRQIELAAQPRTTRRVPLEVCERCPEVLPPGEQVLVEIAGLAPGVRVWIVDEVGAVVGKHRVPVEPADLRTMTFRPQLGHRYFLRFAFPRDLDPSAPVRAGVTLRTATEPVTRTR
jgi:hypothetical protein